MSHKTTALFLALFAAFIDWVGIGLVYPMFSSMLFDPNSLLVLPDTTEAMRGVWLGLLLCLNPICLFFFAPVLGALSDRIGRKKILSYALLVGVGGYALAWYAVKINSLVLLIASRAIVGISAANGAVLSAIIADVSEPQDKAKNFGLMNMAFGAGFTMGPFLGGILSDVTGFGFGRFELPFFCSILVTLLNWIGVIHYLPETNKSPRLSDEPVQLSDGLKNIARACKIVDLRAIYLAMFILCVGWSFFWEFIPATWIGLYKFTPAQIGMVYGCAAGVYAISCGLFIQPIVKRFGPDALVVPALTFLAVAIAALALFDSQDLLWVFVPIQQFLVALVFPVASSIVSNRVSDDRQGEALGVLHSMDSGAFAISPLAAGPLLGLSVKMPIYVGSLAMLAAACVIKLFDKREAAVGDGELSL